MAPLDKAVTPLAPLYKSSRSRSAAGARGRSRSFHSAISLTKAGGSKRSVLLKVRRWTL
jgi:hypothetical protein